MLESGLLQTQYYFAVHVVQPHFTNDGGARASSFPEENKTDTHQRHVLCPEGREKGSCK